MLDQQFEQAVHLARVNAMIIIQHQEQVFRHIGQIVAEQSDQGIKGWKSCRLEQAGRGPESIGEDALQGSRERAHKDCQIVVVLIEGEPGRGAIDRLYPRDQQCGLAKARRSTHQRDLAAKPGVQALEEAGSGDQIAAYTWSIEFGLYQGSVMVDIERNAR